MASNQCLWESYLKCHTVAVSVLGYDEPLLEMTSSVGDLQMALLELNRFIHANAYKVSVSDSLPPGYLYMATVTQPSNLNEADAVRLHQKAMQFFKSAKIRVYLASLEHSAIWHIHYLICCPSYSKNLARDLGKAVGTRVAVERKITTAKRWNGACNYVTKRGYPNDETHVRMLIEELEYLEGKGWSFKA